MKSGWLRATSILLIMTAAAWGAFADYTITVTYTGTCYDKSCYSYNVCDDADPPFCDDVIICNDINPHPCDQSTTFTVPDADGPEILDALIQQFHDDPDVVIAQGESPLPGNIDAAHSGYTNIDDIVNQLEDEGVKPGALMFATPGKVYISGFNPQILPPAKSPFKTWCEEHFGH